jgi:anthranilate phosphoribosyltransferase
MREHAIRFPFHLEDAVDTCGTGGDGSNTFNISTAAAIVMAALGVKVAKHGNRSFSSNSGSADVLEELNLPVQFDVQQALNALNRHSMAFLYAPLYHPAMKYAVLPRKEIGFRTVFNILGPLCNPAGCSRQLIGVYESELAFKLAKVTQRLGIRKALIVSGADGLDECTITSSTRILDVTAESIQTIEITPEDYGLPRGSLKDIQVDTPAESADMIRKVFNGTSNRSAKDIVTLNAAAGLIASGKIDTFEKAVPVVIEALDSGHVLHHYLSMTNAQESAQHA